MIPDETGMSMFTERVASAATAAALLCGACAGDAVTNLPLPPGLTATELLHVSFDEEPGREHVLALSADNITGPLPIDVGIEDTVVFSALLFDESLCELRLLDGPIEPATAPGRCLPQSDRQYRAKIRDGALSRGWGELTNRSDSLDTFVFRGPQTCGGDVVSCLARGECTNEIGAACGPCPTPPAIDAPEEPEPPERPELPSFVGGPDNWIVKTFDEGRIEARIPWDEDEPPCPIGEIRFPGDLACSPLSACPDSKWPEGIVCVGGAIHVDRTVDVSGNGDCDGPVKTIAEAVSMAMAGSTIALAKGEHDIDALALNVPLSIVGACPAETIVRGTGGSTTTPGSLRTTADLRVSRLHYDVTSFGISVRSARLTVENVSMKGGQNAILATARASATLRDVWIDSSTVAVRGQDSSVDAARIAIVGGHAPLQFKNSTAVVTDFILEGATTSADLPHHDFGTWAVTNSNVTLERGWIRNMEGTAIRQSDGVFVGRDLVVTNLDHGGTFGIGIDLPNDVSTTLRRVVIEDVQRGGVYASKVTPTNLDIDNLVIRDVGPSKQPGTDGDYEGRGVVSFGGTMVLNRVYVEDTMRDGIASVGTATITNAKVVNVDFDVDGGLREGGNGFYFSGVTVAHHLHVRRAAFEGIEVTADDLPETVDGILNAEHVIIEETGSNGSGRAFYSGGNRTILKKARFEQQACGLLVRAGSGPINADDVDIRNMWGDKDAASGICGVQVGRSDGDGPPIVATRMRLVNTRGVHLFGSDSTITDLIVEAVEEPTHLLSIANRGSVHVERASLGGTYGNVIEVKDGSTMTVVDTVVRERTLAPDAAEAVLIHRDSAFDATRLDIRAGRAIGVRACGGAAGVQLVDSVVRGRHTAASVPLGFDLEPMSVRVRYEADQFGVCDGQIDPCPTP